MIIARLSGGLGNQMFQYAAARRLAMRHGTSLTLDLAHLRGKAAGVPRSFMLGNFRIRAEVASSWQVALRYGHGRTIFGTAVVRSLAALGIVGPFHPIEERPGGMDVQLVDAPSDAYLIGCWQSEKHFADIAGTIREEFRLRSEPIGRNAEILGIVSATESVAVHVRRGDYASNPVTRATHGLCSPEYFASAGAFIAGKIPASSFFVFSDDPEWAEANIVLPGETVFVTHNSPGEAHEDLRLISACRHKILSNSTLGWWAAWLGDGPERMTVAPRDWYADPSFMWADPAPASWVRL